VRRLSGPSDRWLSVPASAPAAACLAALLGTLALPGAAHGFPQLALRPGGTAFEGPTDPEVTSLFWNPAALSQLRGVHLLVDGQLVLQSGGIDRSPICSMTGLPGACADRSFPHQPVSDLSWSGFAGVTWDFRQDNLTIGFGAYLPWEQHRHLAAPAGSSAPTAAYHLRDEDFQTLVFALGLAVKLSQKLSIGASVSVADAWARLSFDRDTALGGSTAAARASGYENKNNASTVKLAADGGSIWQNGLPSPAGLGISVGVMVQPVGWLYLGASWSRTFPFNTTGNRFTLSRATGASVTTAGSQGYACGRSSNGTPDPCLGGATLVFDLPDVWALGARIALPREVELSAWARVVVYGAYGRNSTADQALVVELSGDPVQKQVAPARLLLARGLQPTVAGELGVRWRPLPPLRLGLSLAAETSAVKPEFLSAEAFEGPKLDGMVAAEVRLRWFRLMLGYELTGLLVGKVDPGGYDPGKATACFDARYALGACTDALAGRALPTNAGSYSLLSHRFSLAFGFDY
jgi:hypothetical protein